MSTRIDKQRITITQHAASMLVSFLDKHESKEKPWIRQKDRVCGAFDQAIAPYDAAVAKCQKYWQGEYQSKVKGKSAEEAQLVAQATNFGLNEALVSLAETDKMGKAPVSVDLSAEDYAWLLGQWNDVIDRPSGPGGRKLCAEITAAISGAKGQENAGQ